MWRQPGYYEIPDILGNAYLKPDAPVAFDLRPVDHSKQISNVHCKVLTCYSLSYSHHLL